MSGDLPSLRPAEPRDAEGIHRIERASFANPWSLESFLGLIRSSGVELSVADGGDGDIRGYSVWWTVAGEAEVANLAVHPEHRGTGVGGRLLDAALAGMVERGGRVVFLEVRESNAAARALYESRGFEVIATRPAYYSRPVEDALIMSRPLSGSGGRGNGKQM
jgi:ribosomal-protein-alanine N-acetyltransferase